MDPDPLTLDIIWESEAEEPPELNCTRFAQDLFALMDEGPVEFSFLVTTDTRMRAFNSTYRGKDKTTDVLSFPTQDYPSPGRVRHLGDIVVSYDQASRQAEEIGQPLAVELRFLLLHGVLHLLGYDHETDDGEMDAYQAELKEKLHPWFQGHTE